MKNNIRGLLLVGSGMVAGALLSATVAVQGAPGKSLLPLNEVRQFTDVYGAIKHFYVEPVEDKRLMKEAISGMLHGLDPHSSFLDEESFKELQEGTMGEFGGLGIEVGSDPAGVKVISPIDDTPAARANIRSGDIIFKIDGKLIRDIPLSDAVKMMRGKPNTQIDLSIVRKGSATPINVKLTRAIIKVKSVKSKPLPDSMGYVRISQFQERTSSELAKALNALNKSGNLKNGLVLDLRNDPGGLLNAAIGVSSAFLPKGSLIVSTKGQVAEAKKEYLAIPQDYQVVKDDDLVDKLPAVTKSMPIVVLVNGASASASEIVAGAMQDHKRATIMGTRSFGKGSVQTVIPLRGEARNTAIKLTTARYFTPSGRSIQAKGITPDVEVKDTAQGNFLDIDIREADLTNHLEVPDDKNNEAKPVPVKAKDEEVPILEINEKTDSKAQPAEETKAAKKPKFYKYGDPDDYQLNQAIYYLKHGSLPPKAKQAAADAKKQEAKADGKVIELESGIKMKVEPIKK